MLKKKVVVYDVNPVHRYPMNDAILDEAVLPGGPPVRIRKEKKSCCLPAACGFTLVLVLFLLAAAFCPLFREFLTNLYNKNAQNGLKGEMSVQDDWIFFPSTNSLYHVVNGSNNWDECQQKCLSLTSHLTSIHTLAENEFVSNLTAGYQKKNEEDTNIWIGIVLSKDGWKNADKTAVDFFNWRLGHMNDYINKNEELICVEMYSHNAEEKKGKWDFVDCSTKLKNCVCKRLPFADSKLINM